MIPMFRTRLNLLRRLPVWLHHARFLLINEVIDIARALNGGSELASFRSDRNMRQVRYLHKLTTPSNKDTYIPMPLKLSTENR